MKNIIFLLSLSTILLFASCSQSKHIKTEEPKVDNIIFLIGDGMGVAQVYAAMSSSSEKLNMEKSNNTGLVTTFSASSFVTPYILSGLKGESSLTLPSNAKP